MPLSALGERFHISVYHLERLFRARTGCSLGRYRLLCRIAAARELLATTEMSVGKSPPGSASGMPATLHGISAAKRAAHRRHTAVPTADEEIPSKFR